MENLNTTSVLQTLKLGFEEREENLKPYLVKHLGSQPAVYCGTYHKYNNGSLDGAWLELDMFDSYEEFYEICTLLHDDEEDPEFMFQDYQGFPSEWYDESDMEESFDKIMDYCRLTEDQREAFDAFYECYGDDDMAHFEERFKGSYDSEEDFAQEIISECYDLDRMMGSLSSYFDYEAYARDLFMTDFTFWDGYVFSDC